MTIILGIDPGIRFVGFGIIEASNYSTKHINHGVINVSKIENISARLAVIFDELQKIIAEYKPNQIAVEEIFMNKNPISTLKLGMGRGVAILVAGIHKIPLFEYRPNEIKKNVVGQGKADKDQVIHMVKVLLNLQDKLKTDAADALAVALCQAHLASFKAKIAYA